MSMTAVIARLLAHFFYTITSNKTYPQHGIYQTTLHMVDNELPSRTQLGREQNTIFMSTCQGKQTILNIACHMLRTRHCAACIFPDTTLSHRMNKTPSHANVHKYWCGIPLAIISRDLAWLAIVREQVAWLCLQYNTIILHLHHWCHTSIAGCGTAS